MRDALDIKTLKMIEGDLPSKAQALVREWAADHKNELLKIWSTHKSLANVPGLFEQVKVDTGGYGVSWNDDIDLSCNELWNNGVIQ